MSGKAYFITGTDTDVGKTHVSCALLTAARQRGLRTAALKPVAAGVEPGSDYNADALALQQVCSEPLGLEALNPVCLHQAIAPHLAAQEAGTALSVQSLLEPCRAVLERPTDLSLVEGAGGWLVPLNAHETLADLAVALRLPVILVVGMRLGCLNHALLSAAAIRASGLPLKGWIANHIAPDMPMAQENVATLATMLAEPLLGVIPYQSGSDSVCSAEAADALLSALLP